jgi:hypothetical protein
MDTETSSVLERWETDGGHIIDAWSSDGKSRAHRIASEDQRQRLLTAPVRKLAPLGRNFVSSDISHLASMRMKFRKGIEAQQFNADGRGVV